MPAFSSAARSALAYPEARRWASRLALSAFVLCSACSSGGGSSSNTAGASAGKTQGSTAQGGQTGQTGGASAGNSGGKSDSGSAVQGGKTASSNAGSSGAGGTAGKATDSSSAAGGTGGKGGTTATNATAGSGGGGQAGSAASSSAGSSASSGGSGGGSGSETGKDAGTPDATVASTPQRLLLVDEGNRRVLLMDMQSPSAAVWSRPLDDRNKYGDSMRDIQLVGKNRVAVSVAKGYVELDLKDGAIQKEVTSFNGVESLRRLPNGNTILGSNDNGATLQELDPQDQAVPGHKVTFPSLQNLRLFRRTPQGTFLLGVGKKLAEVNWDKQTVWDMDIPGGDYVYMGLRIEKNIAVTSGYGSTLLIIDPTTKATQTKIGGKDQPDFANITPNFYAGFQVLANGHYVVTNWEGHGGNNGSKGFQVLEYDASGKLVWHWKQDPSLVSSLHHVIVLDGLDTTKLHDDVNGALAPVTQ